MLSTSIRTDQRLLAELVPHGSRLLEIGCGDGSLLQYLEEQKGVDGRGIDIQADKVSRCLHRGLSVIQGDANSDLGNYPADSFDVVVLSQTLQTTLNPKDVILNMLRIGKQAVVSIPNFGHWQVRLQLLFSGRMPINDTLAFQWYDTPNIHFCTIKDFVALCRAQNIRIDRSILIDGEGASRDFSPNSPWANWVGQQAIFLLSR